MLFSLLSHTSKPAMALQLQCRALSVTASMVKSLRASTSAPMMECKKALEAVGGDADAAAEWLRKNGVAAARSKAGRSTSEGLVGLATEGSVAAMVEVNSETDFVARNEIFQQLVERAVSTMLAHESAPSGVDVEAVGTLIDDDGKSLDSLVEGAAARVRENLTLRRGTRVAVAEGGVVGGYLHNKLAENAGAVGALVAIDSPQGNVLPDSVQLLATEIAMHIVAAKPLYLSIESLPEQDRERERTLLLEQAQSEKGKPAKVLEKIVAGRLNKFYQETVLLEQQYMISEGKITVKELLQEASKKCGCELRLASYKRYEVGSA